MALARPGSHGWALSIEPVGHVGTLLARLIEAANCGPVALGVDFPIGLPRAYASLHPAGAPDFPTFLRALPNRPGFFEVADTLEEISPARPFYPRRGRAGMTRLSHAAALGLGAASSLSRACDRATTQRPAGAPLFWTLGANQTGKAAISAWRDLLLPAMLGPTPPALWPFEGPFRSLLRPGRVAIAETYPADALRQLGLRPIGSKRRQSDRIASLPGLRAAMETLNATPAPTLEPWLTDGFGPDSAGEDRFDCLIGVLCVLLVLTCRRPDTAPPDPWITTWEGWVLGQSTQPVTSA